MDNTDNYVIWIPERDGHAPPYFDNGAHSVLYFNQFSKQWLILSSLSWLAGVEYRVLPEAVNGPPIDDSRNDAEFDVQAWLEQGRANADRLPDGVVLPEPTDWAMEIAEAWWNMVPDQMTDLAEHIRTHCQPREVSNG